MNPVAPAVEAQLAKFENGGLDPADFPHSEHVRLAYEMLARHPFGEAVSRFARGLGYLAAKSGRPQLYHETITVGFLSIIGERRVTTQHSSWPEFMAENRDLLEKDVLRRWYPAEQLQSALARQTFCLPNPRTL